MQSTTTPPNFNLQVLPCIKTAWQNANKQFACPNGFELVSGNCYYVKALSSNNLTKQIVSSNCGRLGGSLVSFETSEKLATVLKWIMSKSISSNYFWINSALYGNAVWAWLSNGSPINYNWATGQINNFNGDAVYLNLNDNLFYVGLSSKSYGTISGLLCEAPVTGLSDNNLNIILNSQTQAYSTSK